MITFTNKQLIDSTGPFQRLTQLPMRGVARYQLLQIVRAMQPLTDDLFTALKTTVVEDQEALLKIEHNVDLPKIAITALDDLPLAVADQLALSWIIEE